MKPAAEGRVQSPASSGEKPSTSWRYWAMKNSLPNTTKSAALFIPRATLKAGTRKRRRSTSGSFRRRWRARKRAPTARPAAIETTAAAPAEPSSAIRLTP